MTLEQALMAAIVALWAALGLLAREYVRAKDSHIAELRETIRYQRTIATQSLGTANRAVDLVERVT